LGPAEILVILVVALIVLGPSRLPEAGRQVGKALAEVRKWSQGFQDEVRSVMDPPVDTSRPSYDQPQPGYTPPIPMVPAETPPPPEESTTTGSHGQIAAPHPDPLGTIDASASDPYEAPTGEPPHL